MAASLGNSAECGKPTSKVIMKDSIHLIFLKWMENRLVVPRAKRREEVVGNRWGSKSTPGRILAVMEMLWVLTASVSAS